MAKTRLSAEEDVEHVLDGTYPHAQGPDPGLGQGGQRETACGVPAEGC